MKPASRLAGITLLGISFAAAALAEAPPTSDGRYTMSPAEGGVVRLDKQTGEMSFCARDGNAWRCEAMPESGKSLREEADRLAAENQRLEAENKHLEEMLGMGGPKPEDGQGAAPDRPMSVPTEEDVDKMFDYIEGMVRKFKERIRQLEKEPKPEERL